MDEPDLVVLARVIDRGSFARAALELGVPPSTLSRRVAALEKRLGVRALERTTRHLRPTELGELLAERGRRVREELEAAERVVADHREIPRGLLRLAIPTPSNEFLGPVLATLLERYSDLRLEVVGAENPLDFIADGFDAAVHVGAVRAAGSLGITRVAYIAPVLAATPGYLKKAPPIRHPRDLADPRHTVVAYGRSRRARKWDFENAAGSVVTVVPPTPRALVSTKVIVAQLIAAGIGIAFVPAAALARHPELRLIEPGGYRPVAGAFSVVTPSAHTMAPKVRAFIEALRAYIVTRPDLFIDQRGR